MSPDIISESDHTYQVYLAHDEVSFPYSFTLPKTATVQQLEQMLCAFGNLTDLIKEGKGVFIFKYDMVPSNPERCFRSILPWLCNRLVPENVMESGKQLKEYFPEGSTSELKASDVIHIVAVTRSMHRELHTSRSACKVPKTYAQRQETVKALYEQVVNVHGKGVVVVRGIPGSGKSTLKNLLANYIYTQHPDAVVQLLNSWMPQTAATVQGCNLRARLRYACENNRSGVRTEWGKSDGAWLLFDEAQDTYWDDFLWRQLLSMRNISYVVLFSAYGRSGSDTESSTSRFAFPFYNIGTHIIGFRPTTSEKLALCFSPTECDEYLINGNHPLLQDDLRGWMYAVTGGHIGAMVSISELISTASKSLIQHQPLNTPLSLEEFFVYFKGPADLIKSLNTASPGLTRSLPSVAQITEFDTSLLDFFRCLLTSDAPLVYSESGPFYQSGLQARKYGWAMIEESSVGWTAEFSSPLHRLWMSFHLLEHPLDDRFKTMTLVQFVTSVISHFSPAVLRSSDRHSMSSLSATSPEPHWQTEFYRAAYAWTNGRGIWLSPEYGTDLGIPRRGSIDFHVGEKKWAIDILRDGDKVEDHLRRFNTPGAYHHWIQTGAITDYIILDFRINQAKKNYPGANEYYRVIFKDDYSGFDLMDCNYNIVSTNSLLQIV